MTPRTTKRQKLSERQQARSEDDDKHKFFAQWASNRGVELHGVEPSPIKGRGVGLVTTKLIHKDERFLFIPEKAMYKPQKIYCKPGTLDPASPQAQLAINVMLDFSVKDSPLAFWAATWPSRQDIAKCMPIYWGKKLTSHLPPSVQHLLLRQKQDYDRDLRSALQVLHEHKLAERDFKYFWMIVNSRSFHWKPHMVLCPLVDYMNHGPSGTTCRVTQTSAGYEVFADRDYGKCISLPFPKASGDFLLYINHSHGSSAEGGFGRGEEVLANYGAHSNDKLLVHYGFVCPSSREQPNLDDDIPIDHLLLPELSPHVRDQLQHVGFLGGYALLQATNELCFKTQVAVRAQLLTCNEWEFFAMNGEDLSEDQTDGVKTFVGPILEKYVNTAQREVDWFRDASECDAERMAKALLLRRWTQIKEAVVLFLRDKGSGL